MDITILVDLGQAARELNLPLESVQRTVNLLDEGNTVPFITRYRKEQTGALNEEQIRRIEEKVGKLRGLAERKQTILRSLQAQNVLTAELAEAIRQATSLKRLEDLYLPYKPKKQTLATTARQRGLEPLAIEILDAQPGAPDLRQRAEALVDPEKELLTVDDVLLGVQHIIAERFSERADVRGKLRKILRRSGRLICSRIENTKTSETAGSQPAAEPTAAGGKKAVAAASADADAVGKKSPPAEPGSAVEGAAEPEAAASRDDGGEQTASEATSASSPSQSQTADATSTAGQQDTPGDASADSPAPTSGDEPTKESAAALATQPPPEAAAENTPEQPTTPPPSAEQPGAEQPGAEQPSAEQPGAEQPSAEQPGAEQANVEQAKVEEASAEQPSAEQSKTAPATTGSAGDAPAPPASPPSKPPEKAAGKSKRGPLSSAMTKKEKKRQRLEAAFKDYYDFQESVSRIPPHRVLAINRGERSRILRVKMSADLDAMTADAQALLIPEDHPYREFLQQCFRDALNRLLMPGLERELRREMTEKAEEHAVDVFARNLRKLLLQPPVHNHRVLAIDPGFRSGCKLIALDEFGNVLDHEIIHVIGKDEWIRKGRAKLVELIRRHKLSVVAIGNGAACRETEQLVVEVMGHELQGEDVAFVIVNEAGASVYSTSPQGREELPGYDAVLRSAISIGRRLLDPLSELVKINPANIGVGMYQHDVKGKHLRKSLDAVVESCVNYVGVDVNTASPALLRYVSGMNQLTARRLCEYRASHGPFRNREQLKQIPGLGEATFVQAAGFLKITSGDNPLDATWIHPESYDVARRVLDAAGCEVADLQSGEGPAPAPVASEFGQLAEPTSTAPAAAAPAAEAKSAAAAEPVTDGHAVTEPTAPEVATAESVGEQASPAQASVGDEAAAPPAGAEHLPTAAEGPPSPGGQVEEGQETATPEMAAPESSEPESAGTEPAEDSSGVGPSAAAPEPSAGPEPADPMVSADGSDAPSETGEKRQEVLKKKVSQLDVASLAEEWSLSEIVLRDILDSLARPGRDPREDLPAPVFRRGIVKLEDLEPGMRLAGTVLNVVDFGAFVDIGLSDSGLVHISRLADRFIRDPHEVVGVGDVLTVWVLEIDKQRRRVALTAIEPGTEKPHESRQRSDKPRGRRPSGKRPPAGKGPHAQKGRGKDRPPRSRDRKGRPPRKPKVVTPITKEMEEGKEPLRSFSDLMQFYQKKQGDEDESKS